MKKKKIKRIPDLLSELGYGVDPRDDIEHEYTHPSAIFKKGDVVKIREDMVEHYCSMPGCPEVTTVGMIVEIGTNGVDEFASWYDVLHTNGVIESWECSSIIKLISPGPGWPNTTE